MLFGGLGVFNLCCLDFVFVLYGCGFMACGRTEVALWVLFVLRFICGVFIVGLFVVLVACGDIGRM